MKVAVFSDVQGNLPALDAAAEHIQAWDPDLVIMAGDLLNRGPDSGLCLDRFLTLRRELGWIPIQGNHEVWVVHCAREPVDAGPEADMRRFADFASSQITGHEDEIAAWADHLCFHGATPDSWVHVTHGTLAGNRNGITASVSDENLAGKLPEDVALFVTAHTHRPLLRHYQGTDILNVGSVGSPFDGDVRASYGQLELREGRWHTRIQRIDYDREEMRRRFTDSGFLDQAGPLAHIIYEEWDSARLLMPAWNRAYREPVLAGEISLQRAVNEYLEKL